MKLPEKKISNPLTIIALFAMIAETSGTIVLPFINEDLQKIYIWFLIGFPILLLFLFFGTLWKKHHVLYSPDDYKSDENFIKMAGIKITKITENDYQQKLLENYLENKDTTVNDKNDFVAEKLQLSYGELIKADYMISEELMLRKLRQRYGNNFKTQIELKGDSFRYRVDGIFENDEEVKIFEIKFFDDASKPLTGVKKSYNAFLDFKEHVNLQTEKRINFIVIIVTIMDDMGKNDLISWIKNNFPANDIIIEIQDYNTLKKEFSIE